MAGSGSKASSKPLSAPLQRLRDYYMTDAISRASPTMAQCIKACNEMRINSSTYTHSPNHPPTHPPTPPSFAYSPRLAAALAGSGKASSKPLSAPLQRLRDYYMTDAISRASPTMAQCIKACNEMRG